MNVGVERLQRQTGWRHGEAAAPHEADTKSTQCFNPADVTVPSALTKKPNSKAAVDIALSTDSCNMRQYHASTLNGKNMSKM